MLASIFLTRMRAALVAIALVAASVTAAAWAQGKPSNTLSVSAQQVQGYLQAEFPRDFDALGGLVSMTASNPQLTIPRDGNRVQMQFDASSNGKALGRVWLSSGLRYDPQKTALFLDAPTVDRVVPSNGRELRERDRQLVSLFLQDYASSEPLYRLDPKLLANFGDVRVESASVEHGQIAVHLNQPVGMPDLSDAK
ncbi:DUF1439 domain-containing protein [Pseudoxanthomonas sp.]|uniref:DUF1439 domain-containing protein n=1 Tax=Pseudoxanthomonas sp. TaxID=1871049 RepID=UPI002638E347|nr:DUF1439 domain-containing protein [Pseudoxanthomonas sp.]WDS37391.1 MAG: DUF1439 domain-containing protein [Pseudoxanthomonas sp.]